MRRLPLAFCFALLALLSACAAAPVAERPITTEVERELERSAVDAKAALWQLAAIQQAKAGGGLVAEGAYHTPAGLEGPISIAWVGPYHELVRSVAAQTGYLYEQNGLAPVNSLIVRVNAEQLPAISVLRDASWQVRDRASLGIEEGARVLRVSFHHAD